MKKLLYRSLAVLVLTLYAAGASAQMKTSYFMEGSIPRYEMNAALTPGHGYVNLPLIPLGSTQLGLESNFLSIDNFIYKRGGRNVTALHPGVDAKEFLKRMPSHPEIGARVNWNLVGFGKYNKRHNYFWSVGLNMRVEAEARLPKELFRAVKTLGNHTYDISDLGLGADAWNEIALGFTMPVCENIVVGGRLKLLLGIGHMDVSASKVDLSVSDSEVGATAAGNFRATIPAHKYGAIPNGKFNFGSQMFDFGGKDWKELVAGLLVPNGYGAAIDLGAEIKLFDKRLKLSLAANDIGFIQWLGKSSIQGCTNNLSLSYKGYNTGKGEWDTSDFDDAEVKKTGNSGYASRLAATLNVGAEWNFLDNLLGVGVLSHTRFGHGAPLSELTLTGTVRPSGWFTASLSHTMIHNKMGIFGFAFNFHPKGVNFFVGADYIAARFAKFEKGNGTGLFMWPRRAKSLNAYVGLAFTIGREKPW